MMGHIGQNVEGVTQDMIMMGHTGLNVEGSHRT